MKTQSSKTSIPFPCFHSQTIQVLRSSTVKSLKSPCMLLCDQNGMGVGFSRPFSCPFLLWIDVIFQAPGPQHWEQLLGHIHVSNADLFCDLQRWQTNAKIVLPINNSSTQTGILSLMDLLKSTIHCYNKKWESIGYANSNREGFFILVLACTGSLISHPPAAVSRKQPRFLEESY